MWCNFIVEWYRKRIHTEEDRDRLEFTLDQPNPNLRLYTLAGRASKRALTATPESDFLAAMSSMQQAKTGG